MKKSLYSDNLDKMDRVFLIGIGRKIRLAILIPICIILSYAHYSLTLLTLSFLAIFELAIFLTYRSERKCDD